MENMERIRWKKLIELNLPPSPQLAYASGCGSLSHLPTWGTSAKTGTATRRQRAKRVAPTAAPAACSATLRAAAKGCSGGQCEVFAAPREWQTCNLVYKIPSSRRTPLEDLAT